MKDETITRILNFTGWTFAFALFAIPAWYYHKFYTNLWADGVLTKAENSTLLAVDSFMEISVYLFIGVIFLLWIIISSLKKFFKSIFSKQVDSCIND